MGGYRDLIAWQRGMDLVARCYQLTRNFPDDERFGLTSQIRRAAVSIPANIAEGSGLRTKKAFANHLWIANGSLRELETHLLLAERLAYLAAQPMQDTMRLTNETGRLILGLRRSLHRKPPKPFDPAPTPND